LGLTKRLLIKNVNKETAQNSARFLYIQYKNWFRHDMMPEINVNIWRDTSKMVALKSAIIVPSVVLSLSLWVEKIGFLQTLHAAQSKRDIIQHNRNRKGK